MGRTYSPLVEKEGKLVFLEDGPELDVNVSGTIFYGVVFDKLGLPSLTIKRRIELDRIRNPDGTEEEREQAEKRIYEVWEREPPTIPHEIVGEEFEELRRKYLLLSPQQILKAVEETIREYPGLVDPSDNSPDTWAQIVNGEILPFLTDPTFKGMASDYCGEYYEDN